MAARTCKHPDIRKFDGVRCCFACGEAVFDGAKDRILTQQHNTAPGQYMYTDLNYKLGREIRLCVLLPGEPSDPLRCDIIHANLDDHPTYDAVSYTWATEACDSSLSSTIQCISGGYLLITSNCSKVLRQLRQPGIRRRLWVDAICINQNNISERNHQAGLMDSIYTLAFRVRICIVKSPDVVAPGFNCSCQDLFQGLINGATDLSYGTQQCLACILSSRYFRRVWVRQYPVGRDIRNCLTPFEQAVQEVALAGTAYLHINENKLLMSPNVCENLKRLYDLYSASLGTLSQRNPRLGIVKTGGYPTVLGALRRDTYQQNHFSLLACLLVGFRSESSDPRDKVFAIISIMPQDARASITVDYTLSCIAVYAKAAVAILLYYKNLDIYKLFDMTGKDSGLTVDQFKTFLSKTYEREQDGGRDWRQWRTVLRDDYNDTQGIWKRTLTWNTIDESCSTSNLDCPYPMPMLIQQARLNTSGTISLPFMQARVHFIDKIAGFVGFSEAIANTLSSSALKVATTRQEEQHDIFPSLSLDQQYNEWINPSSPLKIQLGESEGLRGVPKPADPELVALTLDIFRRNPRSNADNKISCIGGSYYFQDEYPRIDLADLSTYVENATYWEFRTDSTIGYSLEPYRAWESLHPLSIGDEIWAIDGLERLYILRQLSDGTYKVIYECYVWAALELDYWNPGTKKGRWRENSIKPPREEQTRIIEIRQA